MCIYVGGRKREGERESVCVYDGGKKVSVCREEGVKRDRECV